MFSLFVKPSELQRWDCYGCSYSRFLNKYYHKAHSSYALLQRHRGHLGQASPPAPQVATAEPPWCLCCCCPSPALAGAVWRLLCPSTTSYSLELALMASCSATSPVSPRASTRMWMGHQGGSELVSQLGIPIWWGNIELWNTVGGREKKIREDSM